MINPIIYKRKNSDGYKEPHGKIYKQASSSGLQSLACDAEHPKIQICRANGLASSVRRRETTIHAVPKVSLTLNTNNKVFVKSNRSNLIEKSQRRQPRRDQTSSIAIKPKKLRSPRPMRVLN